MDMSSEDDTATDSDFSDDYGTDKAFSINAIIPILGPYVSSWSLSASLLWSEDLIERGKFTAADALLLAFIVDLAMKLYVVDKFQDPVLYIVDDSALAWTILDGVHSSLNKQVHRYGLSSREIMASVEYFYLAAAIDFDAIRERFGITFLQNIQDPDVKRMFARELVIFDRFAKENKMVCNVFRWVYGEWPKAVLTKGNLLCEPITIRQWVYEQN